MKNANKYQIMYNMDFYAKENRLVLLIIHNICV